MNPNNGLGFVARVQVNPRGKTMNVRSMTSAVVFAAAMMLCFGGVAVKFSAKTPILWLVSEIGRERRGGKAKSMFANRTPAVQSSSRDDE